jgi:hypothetical protein
MLFGPDVLQLAAKLLHDPAAERDKEATPNVPTNEAGAALGVQLRPAALAAWHETSRRGQGIEVARFQFVHSGVRGRAFATTGSSGLNLASAT